MIDIDKMATFSCRHVNMHLLFFLDYHYVYSVVLNNTTIVCPIFKFHKKINCALRCKKKSIVNGGHNPG